MGYNNNVMFVRYKLLKKLVAMWKEGDLVDRIDSVPYRMYPRNQKPKGRCCIHKERAVIKYKIMAMMGFTMEDEFNEMDSLHSYAAQLWRKAKGNIALVPLQMELAEQIFTLDIRLAQKTRYISVSTRTQGQ